MCKDPPDSADQYTIKVNVDDIVVLGTDGVFDNLFSYDILHIVNETMGVASRISQSTAKELATRIASAAYSRSIMQDVKTPFQQKMKRVERKTWLSGKQDDITVVVGIIKPFNYQSSQLSSYSQKKKKKKKKKN
eukprot:TRINITY_DN6965_c0_g1_i4.p2 TRINITY_DN6965_c0_g1~~TRINITY_DN6965_c0_g1_i4.p2  ORF type:complete len:134 (-),score=30.54 TRINITY_DN6965_c0_g1_i4:95-496(-)